MLSHQQGLHILADTSDGFGGLAGSVLEELNDSSMKGLLTFGLSPPTFPQTVSLWLIVTVKPEIIFSLVFNMFK